jgi:hypothetical protein
MVDHWQRPDPTLDIFEKLDSRGAMFSSWSRAERARRLASLLLSFDLMYEHYSTLSNGPRTPESISPHELKQWEGAEWPDPNW